MPAEQIPMAQKPVMMRGRRPSFSMVKHCRGRAETDRVEGRSPPGWWHPLYPRSS